METYTLKVAGLERDLPKVQISDNLIIASFVILGDTELIEKCAEELFLKTSKVDVLVCAEAKSIPLTHSLARKNDINYIVLRKSIKVYMQNPFLMQVKSITTLSNQNLVLNGDDINKLRNKNVGIIDDVVSTGGTLQTVEKILKKVEANIKWKASILYEGDNPPKDLIYLEKLPLWRK